MLACARGEIDETKTRKLDRRKGRKSKPINCLRAGACGLHESRVSGPLVVQGGLEAFYPSSCATQAAGTEYRSNIVQAVAMWPFLGVFDRFLSGQLERSKQTGEMGETASRTNLGEMSAAAHDTFQAICQRAIYLHARESKSAVNQAASPRN